MGGLNLRQSHLVIANMLDNRGEHLRRLTASRRHMELLQALRVDLDAAVDRLTGSDDDPVRGLVERHIQSTSGLAKVLTGHRDNPIADPAERAAADRLYDATVVGRMGPRHSAGARVEYADAARRARASFDADLALLPMAVTALLDAWIEGGEAIGLAISDRSDRADEARRSSVEVVREAHKALSRLRRAIRLDRELFDHLPATLEAQILGYADALAPPTSRRRPVEVVEVVEPEVEVEGEVPQPVAPPPANADLLN